MKYFPATFVFFFLVYQSSFAQDSDTTGTFKIRKQQDAPAMSEVPSLRGLTLEEAKIKLGTVNLKFGKVYVDSTVTDATTAIVDSHLPKSGVAVNYGSEVHLFLTQGVLGGKGVIFRQ